MGQFGHRPLPSRHPGRSSSRRGRDGELRALLTDTAWNPGSPGRRSAAGPGFRLGYADDPLTRQIVRALRLSGHILAAHPELVPAQLAGRLLGHPDPAIADWATGLGHRGHLARGWYPSPRLSPPPRLPSSKSSPATKARCCRLRSPPTGPGWSAAAATARCGCGTWPPASSRCRLTGHEGARWRSVAVAADGGQGGGTAAATARCGCGTWPPASSRCLLTGHEWQSAVGGGHRGRGQGGQRRWRRRDGAGVGPGHRPAAAPVHRPRRAGDGGGGQSRTGRPCGLRRRRRDGAGVGPGHRPAAAPLTGHDRPGVRGGGQRRTADRAVSGGDDGTVRVWDLATGQQRRPLTGHDGPVPAVAVSRRRAPRRSPAATTARCGCGTWPPASSSAPLTGHDGAVRSVAVSRRRGQRGHRGGDDGTVRVWDLATGDRCAARSPATRHGAAVAVSARRRPGRSSLRRRRRHGAGVGPGHRPALGAAHRPRRLGVGGGGTARRGQSASPAATTVRCGCGTWPPASGSARSPATTAGCARWRSAPRPAGRVTGGGDGTVRVWDLATGRSRAPLTGHDGPGAAVAVSARRGRAVTYRRLRRHGAGVGPGHRPAAGGPLTGHDGWVTRWRSRADGGRARHRRRRRHGAGVGPGRRRAGVRPAHRPRRPGERGGGQRRRGRAVIVSGGDDGRCGCGTWTRASRARRRSPATTAR